MKKKEIRINLIFVELVILLVVATIFIVYNIKHGTSEMSNNDVKDTTEGDKVKFEERYYDNYWDKQIVADIKDDVPIPVGFTYIQGDIKTGVIIEDNETTSKLLWIPYDSQINEGENCEYYSNVEYSAIDFHSYNSMEKYGGFYIVLSSDFRIDELSQIDQEQYNEAILDSKEEYSEHEIVNSHLIYRSEIAQLESYMEKNIEIENTLKKLDLTTSAIVANLGTASKFTTVDPNNENIYDTKIKMEIDGETVYVPIPVGFKGEGNGTEVMITDDSNENLIFNAEPLLASISAKDLSDESSNIIKNKLSEYEIDDSYMEILDTTTDPIDSYEYEQMVLCSQYVPFIYSAVSELNSDINGNLSTLPKGLNQQFVVNEETGETSVYAKNGDYVRHVSSENKKNNETIGIQYPSIIEEHLEKDENGGLHMDYQSLEYIASKLAENKTSVISSLPYGIQTNVIFLNLLSKNKNNQGIILEDSAGMESSKYSDSEEWESEVNAIKLTNGYWGQAGNLAEVTKLRDNNNNYVTVGGSYATTGTERSVISYQISNDEDIDNDSYGCRPCLFVKNPGSTYTKQDIKLNDYTQLAKGQYDEYSKLDNKTKNWLENISYNPASTTLTTFYNQPVNVVRTDYLMLDDQKSKGYYGAIANYTFLQIAETLHFYLEKEHFTYDNTNLYKVVNYGFAPVENPNRMTNCSHYVDMCLHWAGYPFRTGNNYQKNTWDYPDTINYYSMWTYDIHDYSYEACISEGYLQPGDCVLMHYNDGEQVSDGGTGHVQIYAGDYTWYNAGNTRFIQRDSPTTTDNEWGLRLGFRVPYTAQQWSNMWDVKDIYAYGYEYNTWYYE